METKLMFFILKKGTPNGTKLIENLPQKKINGVPYKIN